MRSPYAENVVKEIWRSPYAASDSIFSASTNFFLLFEYYDFVQDEEINKRLGRGKDVRKIKNHSMQFTVWRYSGKSRMIVEFFVTLLITTIAHVKLKSAIEQDANIQNIINTLRTLEGNYAAHEGFLETQEMIAGEMQQLHTDSQEDFQRFFNNMMSLVWISFVSLFFGFQVMADIAYTTVTNQTYIPNSFKNLMDAFLFIVFLVHIFITFVRNLTYTIEEGPQVIGWDQKADIYCRNYVENFASEHKLLIVGVVALWIRCIQFVAFNEYLGRFLGVVKRLISETVLFFVLYIINLIAFSFLAEAAFREMNEFNTKSEAFITLFYASFGTFDFER